MHIGTRNTNICTHRPGKRSGILILAGATSIRNRAKRSVISIRHTRARIKFTRFVAAQRGWGRLGVSEAVEAFVTTRPSIVGTILVSLFYPGRGYAGSLPLALRSSTQRAWQFPGLFLPASLLSEHQQRRRWPRLEGKYTTSHTITNVIYPPRRLRGKIATAPKLEGCQPTSLLARSL